MISRPYSLICFTSDVPWSTLWKRVQMMMEYLSRNEQIHRVVFVNPEVWLKELVFNFREQLSSSNHKQYKYSWKAVIPRKVSDKVFAVTPLYFLPFLRRNKRLRQVQKTIYHWMLTRLIQSEDFILFLNDFNSNSEHKGLIQCFYEKAKLVVFDWSDDFVEFFRDPREREKVKITCENYIKKAHVVLTVNEHLTQRARMLNPHCYTIVNATDFDHMSKAFYSVWEMPQALHALSKPLIGYTGWVYAERSDSEILTHLAMLHPDWTIVLIGPAHQRFIKRFKSIKNIVFLPPVDYLDLPRYLKFFDVCMIPHKINEHTKGNNPIKIYDYLAAGKPVVSTAISGVEPFKDVIYIARNKEEFSQLVERAMQEDSPILKEKRLKRAKEHSWSTRTEEVWKIIGNYVGN